MLNYSYFIPTFHHQIPTFSYFFLETIPTFFLLFHQRPLSSLSRLTPKSGTFFLEDLAIKIFQCIQEEQLSVNGEECTLSTGKLPLGRLLRNSVVRITDRPDIIPLFTEGLKQQIKLTKRLHFLSTESGEYLVRNHHSPPKERRRDLPHCLLTVGSRLSRSEILKRKKRTR